MAKILVIEDDELARESVVLMLEENGHEVLVADDGDVGMNIFEEAPFDNMPIDIVVTDLIMPNMSGMDVLARVKKQQPDMKVIVISGGGRLTPLSYLDVAKRLGADEVLAKPFRPRDLNASVQTVLDSPSQSVH